MFVEDYASLNAISRRWLLIHSENKYIVFFGPNGFSIIVACAVDMATDRHISKCLEELKGHW